MSTRLGPLAVATSLACVLLTACEPASGRIEGIANRGAPIVEQPDPATMRIAPADLPDGVTGLMLGVTPHLTDAVARLRPTAALLSKRVGVPVALHQSRGYGGLIEDLLAGRVDVALVSPFSYVLARERAPALRLLASATLHGATSYSAFVMVRAGDPARSLEQLRGRRLAFVDQRSGSGYLFPYAALLDHGIDPESAFAEVVYAGSHDAAIRLLQDREVDAACIASGTLEHSIGDDDRPGEPGELRILFKAGRIPFDVVAARPGLPAVVAERLGRAFHTIHTASPEGRRVLGTTDGMTGWIPGDDRRYDGIRSVLRRVREHGGAAP
jgi:phosphonate transport system substrate-binding protein